MAKTDQSKKTVMGKDLDGNDVSVDVLRPTSAHLRKSQMSYNGAFRDALESGALLRQKLDQYMIDQKLWDDNKEKKYQQITKELTLYEKKLKQGGIKLTEAKTLALKMKEKRDEFRDLIAERTAMDGNPAEGQADNARFNSLVIQCIVEKDGDKPLFDSLEEYDKQATEPYLVKAAGELAQMMYNLDPEYDNNLPENKFLRNYKFADQENRLINDDGHLVDEEGRLINEEGRFVNKNGEFVDIDGNRLDEEGEYVIDTKPFLDDNGDPIASPSVDKKKSEKTKDNAKTKATVKTKNAT